MKKTLLHSDYNIKRKLPLNFAEIKGIGKDYLIKPTYSVPATFLCELENAYATPYGIVFKNWKLVEESVYSLFQNKEYYPDFEKNNYLSFFKKLVLKKVKKVKGISVIGHNTYYSNYYHWTTEAMPRLFSLREKASELTLLLPDRMPSFVREYAALLGFDKVVTIEDDEMVLAEKLLLPMHTANGHNQNDILIRELATWLKSRIDLVGFNFRDHRNIYISRERAAYRRVLNEQEVLSLLSDYNFKVINLEDYSVAEQIALLNNVKNFIAVHGAGITNIMYMPENGLVIDLIHEGHFDPSFYNLANALQHDIVFIQGKAANQHPQGVCFDDFSVDIAALKYYLDNHLRQ